MWPSNIMLKRNQEGVECCLEDYQLTRYCPLMFELSFFLYICTRKRLRKDYMKEFMDRYYKEFGEVLKSVGIEVNDVYTYEQFLESYYDIRPTIISKALSYLQIGLLPPERLKLLRNDSKEFGYVLNVDRVGFYDKHDVFEDDIFRVTFRELYEDMYDSFQGDMWPPNIMLKINQEGVKCCLVDYQLTRYCPLTFELSFFLYICTRKRLRKEYMKEFLDRYYKEFGEVLKSVGIEVNDVYTYEQFLESYYDIRPTTISKALSYLQIGLLPPERLNLLRNDSKEFDYVLNVDRVGFYEKHDVFNDDIFRNTVRELYEDLYDAFQEKLL